MLVLKILGTIGIINLFTCVASLFVSNIAETLNNTKLKDISNVVFTFSLIIGFFMALFICITVIWIN